MLARGWYSSNSEEGEKEGRMEGGLCNFYHGQSGQREGNRHHGPAAFSVLKRSVTSEVKATQAIYQFHPCVGGATRIEPCGEAGSVIADRQLYPLVLSFEAQLYSPLSMFGGIGNQLI